MAALSLIALALVLCVLAVIVFGALACEPR